MSTTPDPSTPPRLTTPPARPAPRWCAIGMLLLTVAIAWPFIITHNTSGRGAYDDLLYHWPTIQTFAQELPVPDLTDYQSATTPGYHLELAVLNRLGASKTFIQLYASLWTLLLIGLLAWRAGNAFGKPGVILCLPLLASMYCLFPAIWLLPDNAGWLCVLLLLILALEHPPTTRTLLTSGIVLAFLVLIRQVHIWAAAIIWIAAWMGIQDQTPTPSKLFSDLAPRIRRLILGLIAALPAALILLYFITIWKGLVPPTFQNRHQGPNPITPAFILTQVAILSIFFAPLLLPQLKRTLKSHRNWYIAALIIGLIAALPASSYAMEQGRYSGWWNIINQLPVIADRSLVILLGAPIGALLCALWSTMVSRRDAWIFAATLVAFTAAQSANHASWQRYHEPMLILIGLLILTRSPIAAALPKRVLIGSLALSTMLAAITISTMLKATPVEVPPNLAQPSIPQPSIYESPISQPSAIPIPQSKTHHSP